MDFREAEHLLAEAKAINEKAARAGAEAEKRLAAAKAGQARAQELLIQARTTVLREMRADGYSNREIAKITGWALSTVRGYARGLK